LLSTVSRNRAATAAPMIAPASRCSAARVDCCRLDFIAARAAMGIQSALGRCSPKAIARVIDTATARITAKRISGRVSLTGAVLSGSRRWAQAALSAIRAAGSIDASLLENTFVSCISRAATDT